MFRLRLPSSGLVSVVLLLALALFVPIGTAIAEDRPTELRFDTPGDIPTLDPSQGLVPGPQVRVGDQDLYPRAAVVDPGEQVSWISASRAASTIVFEREVARSMVCHGLVNFRIEQDELRSAELHTGDKASFCELEPGRYRYHVVRVGHDAAPPSEAARRMVGWIIVRDTATSAPTRRPRSLAASQAP